MSDILSVKYPDGSTESYSYDALNRVSNVNSGAAVFTYTVDDKLSTIIYGNGVVTTYNYDSRERPTSIVGKSGSTKVLNLNCTYDSEGRRVKSVQDGGHDGVHLRGDHPNLPEESSNPTLEK